MYWRRSNHWSPIFDEMNRIRQDLNRVHARVQDGYPHQGETPYPAINVWSDEDKLVLTAEIPGVKAEDLSISVEGRTLTLSGNIAEEEKVFDYHRRERSTGKFSRTIELPYDVESSAVEAKLEKGILAVVLPRSEQDKPRRIPIKTR